MVAAQTATFAEHIQELRNRLMWSLLFVVIGAAAGYALHDFVLAALQRPLHETLYYTTPTGAFSFIIKICVVFGFVVALPVIIYQVFGFFGPLLPLKSRRLFAWYVFLSMVLASAGITFAYFVSLPAALHFLVNFGNSTGSIEALITADEYFNFVLTYIAGFAVLFQLPLIIAFINKVTPLPPRKLLGATRYVVIASFILAAIITPTPDPFNQLLMAGPIILLFLISAVMVAIINRVAGRGRVTEQAPAAAFSTAVPQQPAPPSLPEPMPQTLPTRMAVSRRPVAVDAVVRRRPAVAYKSRPTPPRPAVQPIRRRPAKLISDFIPATE